MAPAPRGCPRPWRVLVATVVALVAVGVAGGGGRVAAPRRRPSGGTAGGCGGGGSCGWCTRSVCRAVVGMPHRSLDPFGSGGPTTVTVPLHLVWPARLGCRAPAAASPPVPLVIFLAAALATPRDTASLRTALGRHAVVAAPSYAARNFSGGEPAAGPPGGPPAGGDPTGARLLVRFLENVAAKGGRNGCPPRGVLPSAALINSVLAVLARPPTARGGGACVAAAAAAAAAADPARLVLAGHSMGAAIVLTAAAGGCAGPAVAALTPLISRILCEGYTPPTPPVRGVLAYAAGPPAAGGRAPLPPGVWALAMDGDTDAAVANLASVAAGYAPADSPSQPPAVLLTAGLGRAGHFAPLDYEPGVSTPAGAPRCTSDNAGDGAFVTTRGEAAVARRRFAATVAAATDAAPEDASAGALGVMTVVTAALARRSPRAVAPSLQEIYPRYRGFLAARNRGFFRLLRGLGAG
ncbi:hypothetical protein I4F81_004228 [Pyropia yezoensis]|uniref:Uncharacterized protein n=1 Tax=Pyropia yezoensis TaxID=2788 RepID=A0ACC3BUS0_PYRYE|nr:hypothetical protein I4F81_004228 [Neopyropia yezoensis]